MNNGFANLKRLLSRPDLPRQYRDAAAEIPELLGRLSLLEEFYDINAPGTGERSRILHQHLGASRHPHRGFIRRLLGRLAHV